MTFIKSWEEFEKAAERLYLQEPSKVRYVMKYTHSNSQLLLKMTDNRVVCGETYVKIFLCIKLDLNFSVCSLRLK